MSCNLQPRSRYALFWVWWEVAAPLTDFTKKVQPSKIVWEEAQENAFIALKSLLMVTPRYNDFGIDEGPILTSYSQEGSDMETM